MQHALIRRNCRPHCVERFTSHPVGSKRYFQMIPQPDVPIGSQPSSRNVIDRIGTRISNRRPRSIKSVKVVFTNSPLRRIELDLAWRPSDKRPFLLNLDFK